MITLVIGEADRSQLERFCKEHDIEFYVMENFFAVEAFTKVEEVKNWWEDK